MSNRNGLVAVAVDRSIKIWDLNRATASQDDSNSKPQKTHNLFEPVNSVAFSPDGSLLACGAEDHIYVWNLPSHTIHTVAEVKGRHHNVFFSPTDGLGYTSNVGQIIFRDRDHLTLNWQRMDHGEAISCIAISPKNGSVATGSATGRVRVWLPASRSWKPSMTYELSPAAVTSLAFVNDESFLAAASSTGIWLLGLSNTYKRLSRAIGRTSSVASCQVCNCIVSGGDDGKIRIAATLSADQVTASSPKCIHGNLTSVDSPPAIDSQSKQTSTLTTPTTPPPRSPLHSPVLDSVHSQAPLSSVSPPQSPTSATQPSATPTSASPPDAASAPASPQAPGSSGPSPTAQTRTEHIALPVGRPAAPKSASASAVLNHPGTASHFSTTSIDPFASASADGVYHPAPEADFNPTIISTTKSYSHYFSPRAPYKEPRKCYMCLGYVEHVAGSSEMCRCRG
ncbi:WD40 repeat-like protein [Coniochaeta sp. PMI_546]|nr:WD40 repeat-like protein [Coniochaeta sp. PMI_546]